MTQFNNVNIQNFYYSDGSPLDNLDDDPDLKLFDSEDEEDSGPTLNKIIKENAGTIMITVSPTGDISHLAEFSDPNLFAEMFYYMNKGMFLKSMLQLIYSMCASEEQKDEVDKMVAKYQEFIEKDKETDVDEPVIDPTKVL